MKEILLLGSYPSDELKNFVESMQKEFKIMIKYVFNKFS